MFLIEENDKTVLKHYGILRRSGRYPWGSGDNVSERSKSFLDIVEEYMKKFGFTEKETAEAISRSLDGQADPISVKELRALKTIAKNEYKASQIIMARRLKYEKGYSNQAIADRMGLKNESSVRALLADGEFEKTQQLKTISNLLRETVDKEGIVDVGVGVERHLGISKEKLGAATAMLKEEGYGVETLFAQQLGTGLQTEFKVLVPPGVDGKEAFVRVVVEGNLGEVPQIMAFSKDSGRTVLGLQPPMSIDSNRIKVNWDEDGGTEADGTIYVRPGVDDISLGGNQYAQVRVAVDGTRYLKGMAIYKDDLPDGVDIVFNTNKSKFNGDGTQKTKLDAMKKMEMKPGTNELAANPFGSQIRRQILELDSDGKEVVTSAMNIINEEGSWDTWSKQLSSQVLGKQDRRLAEQQLNLRYERNINDLEEIMSITNPAVKRRLLQEFADEADAQAVHLAAAAMPRQENKVLIPIPGMKDNEVYAPSFKNGERVVLLRHPHGGTFEIPEVIVNNKNPEARRLLGKEPPTAIGINKKVADRLSGADFDGDTVIVIPNNSGRIKSTPPLKELEGWDPISAYPGFDGMPKVTDSTKQQQMGSVSNLITDMTLMGASQSELARAVKHSMVVIDSEKHNLNWKQSEIDNGIRDLRAKYLGRPDKGASTLLSKASGDLYVPERKLRRASKGGPIDPKTGKLVYEETGRTYVNKEGKVQPSQTKTTHLAETDDAFSLSSGTPMETTYAVYSNRMKSLANQARKESLGVKNIPYSPTAKKTYASEVESLKAKLNIAEMNAPLERRAQIVANQIRRQARRDNPQMTKEQKKKVDGQALEEARRRVGASKNRIKLTDREWEAIQAGAISNNMLEDVLRNAHANPEPPFKSVKELATPRSALLMTSTRITRAKSMAQQGYTQAEIADALGVSLTTLKKGLGGE